jgi:hypothetical protein
MNGAPASIIQTLDIERRAQDLRRTWQARALAETKGKTRAVLRAVLFHSYAQAMPVLLRVVFGNTPLGNVGCLPAWVGTAKINLGGQIVCNVASPDRQLVRDVIAYDSEQALIWTFRTLADKLKLPDHERIELIEAVKRWVVADLRIDHLGRKLAS